MARKYYNARQGSKTKTIDELFERFRALYLFFRDKDYFKQKCGVTKTHSSDEFKNEAMIYTGMRPFPLSEWSFLDKTENNIFTVIEFLFDRVTKPVGWTSFEENGYTFQDYESYDEVAGKDEFVAAANAFLGEWRDSYELTIEGEIRRTGGAGLEYILDAPLLAFDKPNVDDKVRLSIAKWTSRHRTLEDMKEAVRLLADVFEYLKKSNDLSLALDDKDSSDIFNIANNFSIRHHHQKQKSGYDRFIWYSWIFHFYLATYHATIRLIYKKRGKALES